MESASGRCIFFGRGSICGGKRIECRKPYQWSFLVPLIGGIGTIESPNWQFFSRLYIPLIVLAYWMIIYHRSHLLREQSKQLLTPTDPRKDDPCPNQLARAVQRPWGIADLKVFGTLDHQKTTPSCGVHHKDLVTWENRAPKD